MKYCRLYLRFMIVYMKGKMEYHFALLLELIANTILIGVYFAGFGVIFTNFETIAGWNQYEVLFMFTTSCNAALYSRQKKHFIFDSINTITEHSFR